MLTGTPGFDEILGNELPRSDNVLFVSTVSEAPGRVVRHLRGYDFHDESPVGQRVFFTSMYPVTKEGFGLLTDAVTVAVAEHGARLLIPRRVTRGAASTREDPE